MNEILNSIDWDSLITAIVTLLSAYGVALLGAFISSIKSAITNNKFKKMIDSKSDLTEADVDAIVANRCAIIEAKYEKKYQEFVNEVTLQLNDNKINNEKEIELATADLEKAIDNIGIEE